MPSKLSIHLSAYPNRTFDILQKMQPGVLKVFNFSSEINIDEVRRRCPHAVLIYRQFTNQDYHGPADSFFNELGDTLHKIRGRGIFWEGINEPIVKSVDDARALNAWTVRFAQLMHAQSELVAGFSWSTGNPTPDIRDAIAPYLAEGAAAVDLHAFHEYYSIAHTQADWAVYRLFEQSLPAASRKPVVITEAGLDDNGNPYDGGWRGKKTPAQYMDILKAYDALLMQDPYVLGAMVYQWGDYSWPSFELDGMIDLFANYVASAGGGLVTSKPWPVYSPPAPQPSYSFSVTPSTIQAGGSATLQWTTQNVTAVTLDGQPVSAGGSRAVTPTQTTTYTLHLVLPDGSTKDLTATLTVQTTPPTTSAIFHANPNTIAAGDPVTLTWATEGATAVSLNGQPVAVSGSLVVTPNVTITYTLHVLFFDGSANDLTATVEVSSVRPIVPTRPPSVVITPNNIAHLKTYPRPSQDNGRGLHFDIDLRETSIPPTIAHLQSIHCQWTLIYAQDPLQAARAARACWNVGIMPVLRIGKKLDEAFDPLAFMSVLTTIGAPPYVQIYNEPGDPREWNHYPAQNLNAMFGASWAEKAKQVYQAGGYPGIQCVDRLEFKAAVDAVGANNPLWQKAFFVQHDYGANHPPAYPYDPRNQQDHPGQTISDDNVGVLLFLDIAQWMLDYIGFVIPIIGGEGGWEYGANQDNRYPKVEQPYHARYHTNGFDWFRTGVLANGEPLPDYVFSFTPWIEGGWGADDWWGGVVGDKTLTTNAVAAIPSFVRKFSWDAAVPVTPTASFAATPTSIVQGTQSTLEWHVDLVGDIYLDGSGVAAHGTLAVTPLQTTTYTLHFVLQDGTTQDLTATVTVTEPPPPPGVQWDSRLDTLGVRLKQSTAVNAWRLKVADYQDPGQTSQDQHIYFKALRADGSNAAGVKFVIDWVGRDSASDPAYVSTDANGRATCPLWAKFDPKLQDGIYFTTTRVGPGDVLSGLGLPNGRHVNYLLTFQYS